MKKADLIKNVVRQQGVQPGNAADQVDQVVNKLVKALQNGRPAHLPGLGTITPGKHWAFRPEHK